MKIAAILLAAALSPVFAQDIKLPPALERLGDRAEHATDVTLGKPLLQMASRFLTDGDADTKKLLAGLDSVYVRSFEFASDGDYSPGDLDVVRAQLQAPNWLRVVGVRSKTSGDNVDVWFKADANGQLGGVVILAGEPHSLTFVSIIGKIDPSQIGGLGGQFGIPRLDLAGIDLRWRRK